MKIRIIKADERGYAKISWLETRYSFSFAGYYDPERMGFGALRVLNDDIIAGGGGFDTHRHDNMEIITIVLKGTLSHQDSTGHTSIIHPHEVQTMSAGQGIMHSERNASSTEPLELFQIWIDTKEQDIEPCYEEKIYKKDFFDKQLVTIASGFDNDIDAAYIHQNARVSVGKFDAGDSIQYMPDSGNGVYIMIIEGTIHLSGNTLHRRDAAEIVETPFINIKAVDNTHLLIIEVPL